METQRPAWTGFRRTNRENRVIMKKWILICKKQIFPTLFDENLKWRGSIWDHFPHSGLPWGAMGDRFFRKEFGKSESQKSKKHQESFISGPKSRFLDFGTIILVRKAARTRLNTSRGPKTLTKYVFNIFGIYYIII